MDDDEFVETSDVEELEELYALKRLSSDFTHASPPHDGNPSPRKRQKRYHIPNDSWPRAPIGLFSSQVSRTAPISRREGSPHPESHHPATIHNQDGQDIQLPEDEALYVQLPCSTGTQKDTLTDLFDSEAHPPSDTSISDKFTSRRSESVDPLLLIGSPSRSGTTIISRPSENDVTEPHMYRERIHIPTSSPPLVSSSPSTEPNAHMINHRSRTPPASQRLASYSESDATQSKLVASPEEKTLIRESTQTLTMSRNRVASQSLVGITSVTEPLVAEVQDDPVLHSRYPLRQRGIRQLKPFSLEFAEYAHALKSAPEAMVKIRGMHHLGLHESQNSDDYQPDDEQAVSGDVDAEDLGTTGQEKEGESATSAKYAFSDALKDLSSTDEDIRQLRKESRAMHKAKLRAHRQANPRNKPIRRHAVKEFPIGESESEDESKENDPINVHASGTPVHETNPSQKRRIIHSSRFGSMSPPRTRSISLSSGSAHNQSSDHDNIGVPAEIDGGDASDDPAFQGRIRILKRMMPASMAHKLLGASTRSSHLRRRPERSVSVHSDENEPLQPGQTRLRRAQNPPDLREIRGDSESSSDERATPLNSSPRLPQGFTLPETHIPSASESPARRVLPKEVIELTDDSSSGSDSGLGSEDGIGDEELKAYLDDPIPKPGHTRTFREESLIDWMLSRTRIVGHTKQKRANRPKNPRSRLNVITQGGRRYGAERQTLLNFERIPRARSSEVAHHPISARNGGRAPVDKNNQSETSNSEDPDPLEPKRLTWKEKEKQRRIKGKENGLYTFTSGATHITSGPTRAARMRVMPADEHFLLGLAPTLASHARATPLIVQPKPLPRAPRVSKPITITERKHQKLSNNKPLKSSVSPPRSPRQHVYHSRSLSPSNPHESVIIPHDLGVPFLPSGISFADTAVFGRGYTHELIEVLSTGVAPSPAPYAGFGFSFDANGDCPAFTETIPKFCEALLAFSTSLPAQDTAANGQEWRSAGQSLCRHLSWFLAHAEGPARETLRKIARNEAARLYERTEDMRLDTSVDEIGLFPSLFIVDLLSRIGDNPFEGDPKTNILHLSLSSLFNQLLQFGLRRSLKPILKKQTLDGRTASRFSVEIWVFVLHATGYFDAKRAPRAAEPLVWTLLQEVHLPHFDSMSTLALSEELWYIIFGLCALSQFSRHGITTSTCTLPASWNFVASVLQKVRLVADPNADQVLPAPSLKKRDEYVALVISRCYLLCHTWKWSLDGASPLFDQLRIVFRSRSYANLLHEKPDYPSFMLLNDWSLLFHYQQKQDTAWVLFWKLIVRAARGTDPSSESQEMPPKVRKQLSLSIPVGAFSFSKASPPSLHDLSMLYNRLSAIAISIYLDPSSISRISQARQYINFANADDTTRGAILRGIMYFATLLLSRKLNITEITDWIKDISVTLADEYKQVAKVKSGEQQTERTKRLSAERDRLSLAVQLLFGAVRHIAQVFHDAHRYPDPQLLLSLTSLLKSSNFPIGRRTALQLRYMVQPILSARVSALPPPQRPQVNNPQSNQESQEDYGSFDIDMNDPAVLAAFGEAGENSTIQAPIANFQQQEDAMYNAINATNLTWTMWRFLHEFGEAPWQDSFSTRAQEADAWIFCWLASVAVLARNKGQSTWDSWLVLCSKAWENLDAKWARRLHLGVMKTLFELDPAAYIPYKAQFMEVLVVSLVSPEMTIEHQYVSQMYSMGVFQQFPFQGTPEVEELAADNSSSFPRMCSSLISSMLSNLNEQLRLQPLGNSLPDKEIDFVGLCIKLLSIIKENLKALDTKERADYLSRYQTILQELPQHHDLASSQRLAHWVKQFQNLEL